MDSREIQQYFLTLSSKTSLKASRRLQQVWLLGLQRGVWKSGNLALHCKGSPHKARDQSPGVGLHHLLPWSNLILWG